MRSQCPQRTRPILACSAAAAIALGTLIAAGSLSKDARADVVWEDGMPIFLDNPRHPRAYRQPAPRQSPVQRARKPFPAQMTGGPRPDIAPQAPQTITFKNQEEPGTIIIDTSARKLYFVLSSKAAYAYPISVGRQGFQWTGTENVTRVAEWPSWHPPAEMRARQPYLPKKMTGGLRNPLGAKAIYLGNTLYRIHGTNDEKTIGYAASSGCFRMLNQHVVHLAQMVDIGTTVKVVKAWNGAADLATLKPGSGQLINQQAIPPLPDRS